MGSPKQRRRQQTTSCLQQLWQSGNHLGRPIVVTKIRCLFITRIEVGVEQGVVVVRINGSELEFLRDPRHFAGALIKDVGWRWLYLLGYLVKWSACSASTLTFCVRIPINSLKLFVKLKLTGKSSKLGHI